MIVESPAGLRLLSALTEIGAIGTTREYLIKRADLSTSTFYRLIGPLVENGIVKALGPRYAIAFDSPYAFRFKLWHDMERLYRLSAEDRDMVSAVVPRLRSQANFRSIRTLWLVGSGARDELSPKSDLDLLLVTDRLEPPFVTGFQRREASVIQMTVSEFKTAVGRADGFVVSALQNGIVLLDDGFSQRFYASPPPINMSAQQSRAEESVTSEYRERVLGQIEGDDLEEARNALRHQGVHVGRLLLRAAGALWDGRERLVEASEKYYGPRWATTLGEAVLDPPRNKDAIVLLSRQIEEQHQAFQAHAEHLESFAGLATEPARRLELLCARLFRELLPASHIRKGGFGVDLHVASDSNSDYLVEIKSSREVVPEALLDDARLALERAKKKLNRPTEMILVVNSWVGSPPFEPVVDLYRARMRHISPSTVTLSGLDLLRAHNRYHLDDTEPSVVLRDLLDGGRKRRGLRRRA